METALDAGIFIHSLAKSAPAVLTRTRAADIRLKFSRIRMNSSDNVIILSIDYGLHKLNTKLWKDKVSGRDIGVRTNLIHFSDKTPFP